MYVQIRMLTIHFKLMAMWKNANWLQVEPVDACVHIYKHQEWILDGWMAQIR